MTTAAVETHTSARKRRSITGQPWFPTFVGVWFAALFGLCSLALPVPLLEGIVSALGVDRVFPAAAPPLGQTARLLLVLGLSGVGEIVGLLIGRRLATKTGRSADADRIAPRRVRDGHPDAPARKPLSALDDLREIEEAVASEPPDEDEIVADEAVDDWDAEPAEQTVSAAVEEPLPVAQPIPGPRVVQSKPRPAVASASLDSLGIVQLSERLAVAIATRRERNALGDEAFPPATVDDWDEPSAAETHPAEVDKPPVVNEAQWGDVLLQRARRETEAVASVETPEPSGSEFVSDHDDIEDETADAPYSSLLDMGPSRLRHAAVQVDEDEAEDGEPVAAFPDRTDRIGASGTSPDPMPASDAQAVPDPAETDRALKAALESLQRISGMR